MSGTTTKFVTCRCQHCDGRIEFDASDFAKGEVRQIECPFCKLETAIFIPQLEAPNVSVPPVLPPTELFPSQLVWFGNENSSLELRLISGLRIQAVAIQLFDAVRLQELATKKALATQSLGGVSTGLGAIGSLSWVLVSTVVIGAIESSLSKGAEKNGMAMLREIRVQEEKLRQQGRFVPVGQIYEIEHPSPNLWRTTPMDGFSLGFTYGGDEFVTLKDSAGLTHSIRWTCIEYYKYHPQK